MKSKSGSILSLIGGIAGLVIGLICIGAGIRAMVSLNTQDSGFLSALFLGLGIWLSISAIAVIVFSRWMNDPKKVMTGSIFVLVLSVIGGGTILGLIGGILGIVDANK